MSMSRKPGDCGWFYHAPSKPRAVEMPIEVPHVSQIPGLNEFPQEEYTTEPQGVTYNETDSKYVRLAKKGGREGLLKFREFKPKSEQPKGYPKAEWFYLEDNALQEAEMRNEYEQKTHEFKLPAYMVHEDQVRDPNFIPSNPMSKKRIPYGFDKKSAFERGDGFTMEDKCKRIPEERKPGYGVRNARPQRIHKFPSPEKLRYIETKSIKGPPQLKTMPLPDEKVNPVMMTKLLANTYDDEWHTDLQTWNKKHGVRKERSKPSDRETTEYQSTIHKMGTMHVGGSSPPKPRVVQHRHSSKENFMAMSAQQKELFKLSKFKGIPSRVVSQ